jgi:hypothetical protein
MYLSELVAGFTFQKCKQLYLSELVTMQLYLSELVSSCTFKKWQAAVPFRIGNQQQQHVETKKNWYQSAAENGNLWHN